jgi:hypothetical protein
VPDNREKPVALVVAQYQSTRSEVLLCMAMEFVVWVLTLVLMIQYQNQPKTLLVLGVAFVWMSGKVGYLMHRLGVFNCNLECDFLNGWGWENLKPTGLMPLFAVGAALPQLYYFATGAYSLIFRSAEPALGDVVFTGVAVVLFAIGAIAVPFSVKLPYRK